MKFQGIDIEFECFSCNSPTTRIFNGRPCCEACSRSIKTFLAAVRDVTP